MTSPSVMVEIPSASRGHACAPRGGAPRRTEAAAGTSPDPRTIATELRDGLLQDLVALGLVVRLAEQSLARREGTATRDAQNALVVAGETIAGDLARLRSLIDRLGGCR